MSISGVGLQIGWYGSDGEEQVSIPSYPIYLNFDTLPFTGNLENVHLVVNESKHYESWWDMEVINAFVEGNGSSGGSLEVSCRERITLYPGFLAEKGSDVHLFNSQTYTGCDDNAGLNKFPGMLSMDHDNQVNTKQIRIQFYDESEFALLYPNPNMGICNIDINEALRPPYQIEITNILGDIIETCNKTENSFKVDLSSQQPEIYFIRISGSDQIDTKKIILQH